MVDEFLQFADLDKNGFLNYAEYVKAMSEENKELQSNQPTLQSDKNEV